MKELRLVEKIDKDEIMLSDLDLSRHLITYSSFGTTYFLSKSTRGKFYPNKYFWLDINGCVFANSTFDSINEAIESVAPAKIKVYEL